MTERQLLLQHQILGEYIRANNLAAQEHKKDETIKNAHTFSKILNIDVKESEILLDDLWLRKFIGKGSGNSSIWDDGLNAFRNQTLVNEALNIRKVNLIESGNKKSMIIVIALPLLWCLFLYIV